MALGLARRAGEVLLLGWRATRRGVIEFYRSSNLTYASSIAYYSLVSMFPFMLLVLSVLGRIAVGRAGNDQAAVELIDRVLPSNFEFLSRQIVQLEQAPIPLTIAGTLVTIWASMGVFGAITNAVNHAWGTEKPYTYLQHKLVAFLMMVAAAIVLLVILLVNGAVQVAGTAWFETVRDWAPWVSTLTSLVARLTFMPALVLAIGLVYYFAPNARVRLRDVWFGAVLAAVLWRLALAAFSWYLANYSRFSVHGSVGTVVAFLVWVYLSAVILLYGVEVTAAYAKIRTGQRAEGKGQREVGG
jgi:membrane protein